MIIQSSNLRFAGISSRREQEETNVQGSLTRGAPVQGNPVAIGSLFSVRENVRLDVAQSSYLYSRSQVTRADQPQQVQVHSREETLQSLVSHAFSRNIRVTSVAALASSASGGRLSPQGQPLASQVSASFSRSYRYEMQEQSALTIEGQLQLADNRTVDFVLHTRLDSSLQFQSASGQFIAAAVRTDPLIINLHGGAAQLTDTAFTFDIDGDGKNENVSFATGGSGFIAFDRNGDGKINDGSELFGTHSGDGFADLAALDEDGNGFLDENDSAFSKLKFYSRNENGKETLHNLRDVGVAAIGLQSAESPVHLRGNAGQELGVVRSTGVFVMDSGAVGTVQQVDLSRRNREEETAFAADFDSAQVTGNAVPTDPRLQKMEEALQKLNQVREEFMARLNNLQDPDKSEDGKSLLELLVDQLKEFVQGIDEEDKSNGPRADHGQPRPGQSLEAGYTEP
ncbi:MAG TPA: VCBS repeat-containing protein [Dongiaceae bacterium]|nr:VCBS repeat-containing protein [Dongiaceae bacterium]